MSVEIDTPEGPVQIARPLPALPIGTARTLRDMARRCRARAARTSGLSSEFEGAILQLLACKRAVRALRAAFPRVRPW